MKFKKQWITALTISALTVGGASALAATNDSDASTKTKSERHHFEGMKKMDMTLLLDKLGITEDEAQVAREDRKSIADLAESKGISFADYKAAELAAAKEQLASLVASGDITKSQSTEMLQRQTERFSGVSSYDELNEQHPQGPRHGDKGGFFNEAFVADVLKALGLSQDDFDAANQSLAAFAKAQSIKFADYKKALLAAQTTQLDQFVKDGKMTEKQATAIKERMTEEFSDATSYDDLPDRGDHGPGHHEDGRDVFGDTTASILASLKLDETKFEAANQPLPAFAEANGIAFADFEKAVISAQTAAVDAKVKDGAITEKQATAIKERIQERADEVSSYDDLKQGPRGGHGGRHHGMNDSQTDESADPNASETSVDLAI
ncbi:hypothetical protein [Exiguobacterium sp. s193]|uniref:hypothetical protein n=1 Tax=Exiguobacterium sp. s193 TaxID=2751207 RepID=UPI001BE6E1F5|nr:hypothetical protein [Exiguobacterium sp. s193]